MHSSFTHHNARWMSAYLMCMEGWEHIEQLLRIAPPFEPSPCMGLRAYSGQLRAPHTSKCFSASEASVWCMQDEHCEEEVELARPTLDAPLPWPCWEESCSPPSSSWGQFCLYYLVRVASPSNKKLDVFLCFLIWLSKALILQLSEIVGDRDGGGNILYVLTLYFLLVLALQGYNFFLLLVHLHSLGATSSQS